MTFLHTDKIGKIAILDEDKYNTSMVEAIKDIEHMQKRPNLLSFYSLVLIQNGLIYE